MLYVPELQNTLNQDQWILANQRLLAKMISEYMYEGMIHPEKIEESIYQLEVKEGKLYQFEARARYFDSYDVKADSIEVTIGEEKRTAESAIEFLLDIQPLIGMSAETAGHLVRELNHTLMADVHLLKEKKTSDELINVDYAELEGYMTGHPWITYNKGRIGFGYDDYLKYAPERQQTIQFQWIAVHNKIASFQSVDGLSFNDLVESELSEHERQEFNQSIEVYGADPNNYYIMPVHEWQWKNVIVPQFAEDLAKQLIIPLGTGNDEYLPQQSIRTFVNRSDSSKHHVKLPMSILNTLVYRGLPSERTLIAPKITEFIKGIYENDDFLKNQCRVILPGEIASMDVTHRYFDKLEHAPYQYLEMLGTIWRESIYTYLEDGEQAITLAALLHEDHQGKPFIQSLIEQSELTTEEWMEKFFGIVMDPLLHFMYQYGTVFSPHGQNTILVLKNNQPQRLAVKDFVDDVNISDQPFEELSGLTQELKNVLRSEPPEGLTQFIFTGLFICHLRYLASLLDNRKMLSDDVFWRYLAESIKNYQEKFPHLQERFELFDFFQDKLTKLCLNRNRMVDYGYEDGDDRPHASEYGKVNNALSLWKNTVIQ
ncbi:IucA/IucC family siderophore biosynthesis protein [Halobacillus sp. Marseille-Q1614]|uniref:IucA/IucC family protein n=1 Tax=Halobacillus sp. Marseille-Q1614 TaxID=2709134 RepID=UPI00156DA336|nr:IucA/IucC family siderophore biosynthesis protein [Halobacillus sp. Marseille-Q1614]